ncbi:hypothetical protein FHT08_003277 [Xanthomonas campestris]|uniref:hypothetical protein n=1 Tax=Xanthomonas sp. CFBP 8151 TaxID=3035310 RepID=UPI00141B2108|nr:hypothetical protein [Xanthomonas sp. CFBP 8151]NIJ78157.1 hypothetical protein [Xanthomonas sp. CFBP 8151]
MLPVLPDEGVLRAAFRLTLDRVQSMASMGLIDEEGLTASILGGVSTVAPLLEQLVLCEAEKVEVQSDCISVDSSPPSIGNSGAHSSEPVASWGTYTKSGGAADPLSETSTGGDFALVIWDGAGSARLAIFQAKKGTVHKREDKWTLNIRRGPTKTSKGFTQFVMLFANALKCSQARLKQDGFKIAESFKAIALSELKKELKKISWVHYLAYMEGTFACVPLAACTAALADEVGVIGKSNTIEISIKSPPFRLVIDAGFKGKSKMWLSISRKNLEALLPSLLHLMPVHVVDEKGAGGLILGTMAGTPFFVSRESGSKYPPMAPK